MYSFSALNPFGIHKNSQLSDDITNVASQAFSPLPQRETGLDACAEHTSKCFCEVT